MSRTKKTAVLVAERGGEWSEWVEPLREDVDEFAIVLQRQGESPSELATRVRERVAELQLEGELVAAALVGGDRWDPDTLSARSLMIRAMVSQMVPTGRGRLFLDGGERAGRGRHAMQALAAVVEDQVGGGIAVSTQSPNVPPMAPARAA